MEGKPKGVGYRAVLYKVGELGSVIPTLRNLSRKIPYPRKPFSPWTMHLTSKRTFSKRSSLRRFSPVRPTPKALQPMDQQVISTSKRLFTNHLFRRCFQVTQSTSLTLWEFCKDHNNNVICLRIVDMACRVLQRGPWPLRGRNVARGCVRNGLRNTRTWDIEWWNE